MRLASPLPIGSRLAFLAALLLGVAELGALQAWKLKDRLRGRHGRS